MDARMRTLLRFSPGAAEIVISAADKFKSRAQFLEEIGAYNSMHDAQGAPAEGKVVEQFTTNPISGRTITATLYENGRVHLEGAEGTVH